MEATNSNSFSNLLDIVRGTLLDRLTHTGFLWEVIIGTSIAFILIMGFYKLATPAMKAISAAVKAFWNDIIMGAVEFITDALTNIPLPKVNVDFEKPKKKKPETEIQVELKE